MKKVRVKYLGLHAISVVGIGKVEPGDSVQVSEEMAERLVTRADFSISTPPKGGKEVSGIPDDN